MNAGYGVLGESTIGQEFGYTGRRHDVEDTGLMYFRARYYSGELGRFVGRDPLGTALDVNWMNFLNELSAGDNYSDGMNLYMAYFVVNGIDWSGMAKCDCNAESDLVNKLNTEQSRLENVMKSLKEAEKLSKELISKIKSRLRSLVLAAALACERPSGGGGNANTFCNVILNDISSNQKDLIAANVALDAIERGKESITQALVDNYASLIRAQDDLTRCGKRISEDPCCK